MVTKVSDTVVETKYEREFKYLPYESSGLNFVIAEGTLVEIADDGGPITYPKQTLILTDNATNYIYLEFDNTPATLEVSTTAPTENVMLIYRVVTLSGVVSSIVDYRWKSLNNRYQSEPYWPAAGTENELVLFKHRTGTGFDQFTIIRGLDTPYERYSVVSEKKANDLRIVADDGTTGANAYGYWRTMSPDGARMVQQRNVNGSTSVPFTAFELDSSGVGPTDWIALATPPQMINDSSTPVTSQLYTTVYNPVYQEVVLVGTDWWVYDDNEDGTYSVNRPVDSFDIQPLGNGSRTAQTCAFSNDGEVFASNYVGGSELSFYDRSATGARYQQVNTDTASVNVHSGLCYWDEGNSEFFFMSNNTPFVNMAGYAFNGGTGNWEEQWTEDATSNSDLTIDNTVHSVWISPDGSTMLVAARRTSANGMFKFDRRAGGGWDYDATWDVPGSADITWDYAAIKQIKVDGSNVYLYVCTIGGASSTGFDRIWKWNGSTFSEVVVLSGGYDDANFNGSTFPQAGPAAAENSICVTKDGTLSDPVDAIWKKYDPFWYWYHYTTLGQDNFDYQKQVYGWINDKFDADLDVPGFGNWYVYNTDSSVVTGPSEVSGPIANTYAFEVVTGTQDIQSPNGIYDQNKLLANTDITIPEAGIEGTMVVVWKSPTTWQAVSDAATTVRVIAAFGNTGAPLTTQPLWTLGLGINSLGANATWKIAACDDNGADEALLLESTTTITPNQWNVTVCTMDPSDGGLKVYNNGTLIEFPTRNTTYQWAGGDYMWWSKPTLNKRLAMGAFNSTTSYEIIGAAFHALGYFDTKFNATDAANFAAEYGL